MLFLSLAAASKVVAKAAPVLRVPSPNGFPISESVQISAGIRTVFVSGQIADAGDAPGDTRQQTAKVIGKIESALAKRNCQLSDVVKLTAFLVGDPRMSGRMDFAGFNAAYGQFFGTPRTPTLPTRSTVQVVGLAAPGLLVEIEAIAAGCTHSDDGKTSDFKRQSHHASANSTNNRSHGDDNDKALAPKP